MPRTKTSEPRIRAAALVVRNNTVLLARHRKGNREYFLLPGGGIENDEFARDALARELHEEAGVVCAVGALRYVVEAHAPRGARHVVQLVFEADVDGALGPSRDPRVAECAWHPVSALRTLHIHPDVGDIIADDIESGRHELRYLVAVWRP